MLQSHPRPFLAPILGVVAALIAGTTIAASETSAQDQTAPSTTASEPVLLELFTSQGCSSCPPADRVAAKIDREGSAVVISRPVTYWDRLGWKDTLAREENTQLQRNYARKGLAGRNGVYTPQTVTNGQFGIVGSQENALRRQMRQARGHFGAAIRTRPLKNGSVAIGISGPQSGRGEIILVAAQHHATVAIGRGENSGRTITYTNVVRSERKLADWNGGTLGLEIKPSDLKVSGADRYALILRQIDAGRVLAARWIR